MSRIGIIGGGIIGLCSAYYLKKAGHDVTIIDRGNLEDGCSMGNAGMIVPSHFIPLAAPGMISKGIRWMFNSKSPFYVRPRLSSALLQWGFHFYRHANEKHVEESIPALRDLSILSKELYQQLASSLPFDFGFEERGLMMLFHDRETEKEEIHTAQLANSIGIEARVLTATEVQQMEPDVEVNTRGGIYFPGDAHLTPASLVKQLIGYLREQGVQFKLNTAVQSFRLNENKVESVVTQGGDLSFDEVVLAAGSWSGEVADRLHLNIPMQAGKGYSFLLKDVKKNVRIPSIFLEARVAVTPMGNDLRFGGTMEIAGVNHSINMNRVRGIVESIPKYYPSMHVSLPATEQVWHGLRPCSPDGLPYIGRSIRFSNLVIATGHSMMGVSLGPATGKLVAELVDGERPSVSLTKFDPTRYE